MIIVVDVSDRFSVEKFELWFSNDQASCVLMNQLLGDDHEISAEIVWLPPRQVNQWTGKGCVQNERDGALPAFTSHHSFRELWLSYQNLSPYFCHVLTSTVGKGGNNNSYHLCPDSSVSGAILSVLHVLIHLVFTSVWASYCYWSQF